FYIFRYASNADHLSTDDLLLFLEAEQGMQRVTKDKCLEIISHFEPTKEGRGKGHLGIDGFTAYLLSEECDIFDEEHKEVCQDMTQSLTHYFISTSHNTYLLEDQLKGPSSIDGYISALKKGCRCLELDCWDGPNEEPIIYHGHTLTSKISFRGVIEAIYEHAFTKSHESQALKLAMSCPEEFVNHNKRYLSRIYPNGMRVDSSNYNPQDLWNCGCQMVALNYQTAGLMMDLYNGWFKKNGGCGFVLKPSIMREEIAYFSASTREVIPGVSPQILHIKIISGQNFPKPKGSAAKGDVTDPYVNIEVFGIPADCAEERTRTIAHNGYNPIFDESFEFQINLPELALIRFAVLDDEYIGDEFIGQYTIPFECMQTGYRHIRLLSYTGGIILNCTLFVHIAITNKRGGGSYKRGMSVKKTKRSRDYTSMKSIGVKAIDETFKIAIQPLRDGTDLRDDVQISLAAFKETCGLAPIANIKQCIRLLATRIANCGEQSSLTYVMKGEYPCLEAQGNLPDILRKALMSFEDLISDCKNVINNADMVHEKLLHCQRAGLEWHEELETVCQQAGLRTKKLTKATENFAWNIRVLKGQADLVLQSKKDCEEYVRQIKEAAVSTGLAKQQIEQQ
ncbi:hypothetical protein LOTGIDRAFT_51557, partial [Lottia gigantea]